MKKLFLLASVIFSLNAFSQIPSYVPSNGLVAWYPFNGNANDESANGYNGANTGSTNSILSTDRFGNINSSYYMPLNSNIATSYPGVLGGNSRSVNYWMKTTNTNYIVPLGWGSTTIQGGRFSCSFNFINPGVTIDIANSAITYASNQPVSDNNWHMYTWVFDNSIGNSINYVKIYQDGILLTNVAVNYNDFEIINTLSQINLSFGGQDNFIDDIGIWNRALTQQEITTLYNATSCANNTTISPQTNSLTTGSTAVFTATTTDPNPSYVWQSDLGQGFQTLNNYGAYSGVNTSNLSISNVQLANHLQPIRVIATSGTCIDTSNVATITISDTCIVTINDTITTLISVTDTLIINSTITSLMPPNNTNTIKVFPNPTNDHITINYGNFAAMNGYTLKITNALGQVVFTSPINQQISYLDLSTWGGNGIYFIQIINPQNNTIENRKIVLQ